MYILLAYHLASGSLPLSCKLASCWHFSVVHYTELLVTVKVHPGKKRRKLTPMGQPMTSGMGADVKYSLFPSLSAWNCGHVLSVTSGDTSETEPQFPRVVTSSTTHPCVRLPPSLPPTAPLLFLGITSKTKLPEDKYYILMHICGI